MAAALKKDRKDIFGLASCLCFFVLLQALCVSCTQADLSGRGCRTCHRVSLDRQHDLPCQRCHRGNGKATDKALAHRGLVARPASPSMASAYCAPCHEAEARNVLSSTHYTLADEISLSWKAFFPSDGHVSIEDIRGVERPDTPRKLVADFLARRCLRCHVHYGGDDYHGTDHGTGCAACHMPVGDRSRHQFGPPDTKNCLSCHHANFVGWDYVGRFEKDYPEDFRAPLEKGRHVRRPYGVEWIQMAPDVHYMAGFSCLDCHLKGLFHVEKSEPAIRSCTDCHNAITPIRGHSPSSGPCTADCQTCHAVWAVWDQGRSLLRLDRPDLEEWQFLAVQGSSEVERFVSRHAEAEDPDLWPPLMSDKFSGVDYPGLWFAAFWNRRWAPVVLGQSREGSISVMRPLMDLTIGYADASGETVIDGLRSRGTGAYRFIYPEEAATDENFAKKAPYCLPYHPHTISRADAARTVAVQMHLEQCEEGNVTLKRR